MNALHRPVSEHMRLEVSAAQWRGAGSSEPAYLTELLRDWYPGEPLPPAARAFVDYVAADPARLPDGAPVPGCHCPDCTGIMPDPIAPPDLHAVICPRCGCYRDLARDPECVFYVCATCRTRSAETWAHSAAGTMLDGLPRVLTSPRRARVLDFRAARARLDVEGARAARILDVARSLGIVPTRTLRNGDGWALCPFHSDSSPSLHLNARKNAAFCNPCARSWDSIALTMELRRLSFADAVRELADELPA